MDPDSGDEPFSTGPFRQFFLSQESAIFRHALAELNLGLNLAEVAGLPIDPRQYNDVARVIVDRLLSWLERDLSEAKGISSWIGADGPLDVEITAHRGRAAEILAFAGFLMVAGAGQPERLMAGMARAAFGLDPLSTQIGDILRGRHVDLDWGRLPQTLDSLRDVLANTCVVGITHAGARLGLGSATHGSRTIPHRRGIGLSRARATSMPRPSPRRIRQSPTGSSRGSHRSRMARKGTQ